MGKVNWGRRASGIFLLCLTTAIGSQAQTFTTLHSFDFSDGESPVAGLVQATNGNLYATTIYGGPNNVGTVFQITPSGKLTMIYSFDGPSADPFAGLVQATNGNLYGTTCCAGVSGTVFQITPGGKLTTIYSFCSRNGCPDGGDPRAGLAQATNGKLYGTTYYGGANNVGTVFQITPSGKLTTIYSFDGTDGANPFAGLVQATNGKLYGTTYYGGANDVGTVFQITPSGKLTTIYSFAGTGGANPIAGLVQAANGNLYGTTNRGGANDYGTVFKITPSGKLTTLYSFCSQNGCSDGGGPRAGLVQATNGKLYGTTSLAGAYNGGTVFQITPSGKLTTLYSFCSRDSCTDGSNPYAGLVQATNGNLYGTTDAGGTHNAGTVFRLSVGLGPFVETQPTSGKVGAAVKILGTNLAGATRVTLNGTAAKFTVVSKSEIKTTVPDGATTGKVKVKTPSSTLSSNVPFRVAK
jgi:uncharacterized repeat protein (TIGR03803 family)